MDHSLFRAHGKTMGHEVQSIRSWIISFIPLDSFFRSFIEKIFIAEQVVAPLIPNHLLARLNASEVVADKTLERVSTIPLHVDKIEKNLPSLSS